jgi:hypothetical protein
MRALMITLLLLLAIPATVWSQIVEQNYGGMSYYNGPNLSGTRQSIGGMDYFNFSDGSSTTRQSFGGIDYYSGNRHGLSGSVQSFGNLGFGSWNDGTQSTHQSFGSMDYHSFQGGGRALNCTSQRVGNQTYTNCY